MKNPRPSCLVRIIEPLEFENNKLLSGVKLFKVLKNVVADAWWWGIMKPWLIWGICWRKNMKKKHRPSALVWVVSSKIHERFLERGVNIYHWKGVKQWRNEPRRCTVWWRDDNGIIDNADLFEDGVPIEGEVLSEEAELFSSNVR